MTSTNADAQVSIPHDGIIVTLAGNTVAGYSGDSSLATGAELNYPVGVAVDSTGNVYIADYSNNVIRMESAATGVITTVAGNGTAGYSGDGGAGVSAELNGPEGIAVDSAGNLYIADQNNCVIRKLTISTGIITTVAGDPINPWGGYSGDGGPATSAEMSFPNGVAVDASGNIYIADQYNNVIRMVSVSTGVITTVAGNGTAGYSGDGAAATSATLNSPTDVRVDSAGNIFIADLNNEVVREVSASTGIITTVAGTGTQGYSGDGGPATSATFAFPTFLALDAAGNLYIADSGNELIRKVTASTGIITTVVGNGVPGFSGDGGLATAADLNSPAGIAVAPAGNFYATNNLYFADSSNNVVRAVGGYRVAAPIFSPISATYSTAQSVTISDSISGATIYYTTDGTAPTTSSSVYSGPITVSSTQTLNAIAVTNTGLLSALGTAPYTITQVVPTVDFSAGFTTEDLSLVDTTIVSGALQLSDNNPGEQRAAWFTTPVSAQAFTSDFDYQISSPVADGITFTLQNDPAGIDALGYDGDALGYQSIQSSVAIKFDMYNNFGEGIDSTGFYTNGALPTLPALDMTASGVILHSGDLMHVHISYDGTTLTWTISDTVTKANFTDSVVVNIPSIVGASTAYVGITGSTGTFASTQNITNWTFISGAATTYAATPTFSPAPGTYSTAQNVTISDSTSGATIHYTTDGTTPTSSSPVFSSAIAVSASQTLKAIAVATGFYDSAVASGTYTISGGGAVGVAVSPGTASLYAGQTQQFTATVTNTSNTAVTWSLSPSGSGSVSSTGLYTAPSTITTQQTVTITATSQADSTKSATATIGLYPPCASNEYSHLRSIVIDHTKVPNTDQINFPFLFNTTDPSFATTANGGHVANSNGYDIIFSTDPNGATKLDHELEEYNPTTGQIVAWVRVPALSHTSDTIIYVLYGNPTVTTSQQNPTGVWDSNYQGVWHVPNGTLLSLADSTSNANNATNDGASATAGMIDGGMLTDGTTYATIGAPSNLANLGHGNATFSAWVNPTTPGGMILGKAGFLEGGWTLALDRFNRLALNIYDADGGYAGTSASIGSGWSYVTATLTQNPADLTQSQISLYINGALSDTFTMRLDNPVDDSGASAYLEDNDVQDFDDKVLGPLNGSADEFRISNVARSADWIATEYNNEVSPSTFYAVASEDVAITPASVGLYASQSQQFSALRSISCPGSVIWSASPTGVGVLTDGGLYTAPASIDVQQTVTITETLQTDTTKSSSATVTLFPPVTISVTPGTVTLHDGDQPQQFTANVANANNTAVTWTISPSGVGAIDANGVFSAPAYISSEQTVTVTATSQVDPTKSASATITLIPATLPPPLCGSSGYSFQRSIVVDHTKVPNTDQTSFPFLFNSTDPAFATTANGGHVIDFHGNDIIFSLDPTGETKLDHELEEYNPVTGQVIAWVRIPTLSHTTDTVIYMFYGNASVTTSQQNPAGVWDSNYKGVWHVANGSILSLVDSTSNGNNATNNGATATAGQIDGGMHTNGTTFATIGAPASLANLAQGNATFSAWVKTTSGTGGILMGKNGEDAYPGWVLSVDDNNNVEFVAAYSDSMLELNSSQTLSDAAWSYIAVTLMGNSAPDPQATIYVNGVIVGTASGAGDSVDDSTQVAFLADATSAYNTATPLNGSADEFRISNTLRSADWIATEYNNQSLPSSFYTLSTENAVIAPVSVILYGAQSQQFTPTLLSNCSVTWVWSISPSGVGTVSTNGLYNAPTTITTQQDVTVTAASQADSTKAISATITLMPPVAVSVNPASITLSDSNQPQQFAAVVSNTSNTAVTWSISPAGVGTIDSTGLYTVPPSITSQQTVTVTATSQADNTKSGSAVITLLPVAPSATQCVSNGYNYSRAIAIDHTKVPQADKTNFPFLFSTIDPSLATTANGGHVTNFKGYDIIFSTDPSGRTKLDHEIEEYNPVTGQIIAWVRIPTLSHSTDTVLYVFYGNPNIAAPQQNPTGVWDSNYRAVYHFANVTTGTASDSTTNNNNGSLASVSPSSGDVDGAAGFDGATSYIQLPSAAFPNYPTDGSTTAYSMSFGAWFKTASSGMILGQTNGEAQPGVPGGGFAPALYVDGTGHLLAWVFNLVGTPQIVTTAAYNDNNWHFVFVTYDNGTETLYVDGQDVGHQVGAVQQAYDSTYDYFLGTGQSGYSWFYFQGSLDEVSLSNTARSAEWIQTEYLNQSSPSTFSTLYPEIAQAIVPSAVTLYASQFQQFVVPGMCSAPDTVWSMPAGMPGTLSTSGFYTAPASIESQQTLTLTATTLGASSASTSATVTLMPPVAIKVTPASSTLSAGQTQQFSATVTNASDATVTWSVSPLGTGTISALGLYTAPASVTTQQNVVITATSEADTNQYASASITLTLTAPPPPVSITLTPTSATLYSAQVQQFTAAVTNTDNTAVEWTINPSGVGTITSEGLYTAPTGITTDQTITVTATSEADTTKSASTTIALAPAPCGSSGYSYVRTVSIDHTKVPNTDQSNFPLLFNVTAPWLASTANGGHVNSSSGYDIFFSTDPTGSTKLDHEIETYNPVTGQFVAWVRVPTLSHTSDTVIYVFYGNSAITATQEHAVGVWDTNFSAVYHLDNTSAGLSVADSTSNGNSGIAGNNGIALPTPAAGILGTGSASFNGNQAVYLPSLSISTFTLSAWIRPTAYGETGSILGGPAWDMETRVGIGSTLNLIGQDAGDVIGISSTPVSTNAWNHVAVSYDGLTANFYINGVPSGSSLNITTFTPGNYLIGEAGGQPDNFIGDIGELQLSSSIRSADWVATEYNNQSSPTTFYSVSSENGFFVSPATVGLYASQSQQLAATGTCGAAANWSMPAGSPGTLSSAGLYTAPASITEVQTVTVTATSQADASISSTATITLLPPVSVSVTPGSVTLTPDQAQQFRAVVANSVYQAVTWSISPAGTGTIDENGVYSAPSTITSQQTVTVTATSQEDPTKSASATITIAPTLCAAAGFGYQRVIVIDHTKVANADQVNFPFLFNTTDPDLANTASGGHVANLNGYDIMFSTDPNGLTKLDHELEEYNPTTGQTIAWIRIPSLSHTTDTVLYVFYGNPNVLSSQQNPQGVWDSNYQAVYHMANVGTGTAADSTSNANDGPLTSVTGISGEIDGAAGFNGSSSYLQIPSSAFPNFPTGAYSDLGLPESATTTPFQATVGVWFKTSSAGGILQQSQGQTCTSQVFGFCLTYSPTAPGQDVTVIAGWSDAIFVNEDGNLTAGGITTTRAYNDNQWHYAAVTYATDGTNTLYVDGQNVGSQLGNLPVGYSATYAYFVGVADTRLSTLGNYDWLYFNGSLDDFRVSSVPRSGDWIQTEYNNQSSPSTFYSFYPAYSAQIVPPTASLYAAQTQQFAATGLSSCNATVAWSMPSGAPGTLTSGGLYTAPNAVTSQQTVTLTATSQASGTTIGFSVVTLLPPPSPISLVAATLPPYVTGTTQAFTVTLNDPSGTPEPGVVVNFSVSGSNSSLGSSTSDANGVASYAYNGTNSGSDTIQATAVVDGRLFTSNSLSATWVMPTTSSPQASVTLVTPPVLGLGGLVGAFTDSTGSVIEPLAIGGAANTFVVPTGATQLQLGIDDSYFEDNGGSGFVVSVNGSSITVPATTMPWTWVTGGLNNNFQFGFKDGTAPIVVATGLVPGANVRIAYQSGTVSTHYPAGSPVKAGGDPATLTGITFSQGVPYPTLYTTPTSYPVGQPAPVTALVTNSSGLPAANVSVQLNVSGSNPGQFDATTDSTGTAVFSYAGAFTGNDVLQAQAFPSGNPTLTSNQSGIDWANYPVPPALASLALTYYTVDNDSQSYIVLATDGSGNPVGNAPVGFYASGVDAVQESGTTDITGHAPFFYFHQNAGAYSIIAATTINRNVIFSNTITGTWTPPATTTSGGNPNTISIKISAQSTVTLPNTLQLNGTVTDSSGLTPALTWSQASGPGTVTFTDPTQATTTASFSEAGKYVVQLSATDTSVTGSTLFSVTVRPNEPPQTIQGWIGSPQYGSIVSGIVPITLSPGVTLQSGTLVVSPGNDPYNTTTLNANTTGSGQIGILDTTTLPNGTYWIQLQSTETNGQSEYDIALVTVAGNYKPGRLTTSITDLVVPATGLAINIQRSYDSLNAGTSSDFGYGWSLGTTVNLTVDSANDVTFTLGGQRRTFFFTPQGPPCGGILCPLDFNFAAFTPEPGFHGTLTSSAPGCSSGLDIMALDGGSWVCATGGLYTPPGYIYTDPSGTAYNISANGSLQSIVDRVGNALTITPAGIISSTGLSVPFVRDSNGRITKITDPMGNNYLYSYDSNGNLASVTYPNTTQPSTYAYDTNHLYLSGTDFRNNPLPVTAYYSATDFDSNGLPLNGRVKSGTDALGQTRAYAYDLIQNSMTVTFPPDASGVVGAETSVDDNYGMMLSYTNPLGFTTHYTYDSNHNRISETDPLGHTTTYTYDSNGNTTSVTYPATSTSSNTTSYTTYNQYSQPTSTTDELGNVRVYNYDANYNAQSVVDSIGTVASYLFNASGQPLAAVAGYDITQQPNKASQYTYDTNGNLASSTDPLGHTTSYAYNALGQKISATVPIPGSNVGGPASTTTFQYDPFGNLLQTSAPLGEITSSQYDANNNRISSTDARGNVTTFQYDVLNRLTSTTYPTQPSTTTSQTYDFRNNIVNSTDQNGSITHNTYDLAGKLHSVTRAYGTSNASTTTYTYYADGRKQSDTDSLGHTTTYTYDQAGRLIAVANAAGSTQYTYDDAGNQIAVKDPNGNTTQSQYDARKRITKTIFPDTTTTTSAYDGPSNVISTTDQAGNVVQNTYNAANQLISTTYLSSPNAPNNTAAFAYNSDGNQTVMTDENGHATQSVFDVLSRLTSTTLPDGSLTESRQYDVAGNLVSLTHFNGKTTTYTYDSLNRLTVKTPDPSLNEPTVSFTYTPTGQRATMIDGSGTTTYTYDSLDRLTVKATPEGSLSYTYDAAGNVESVTSSNSNGVSLSYTYDDVGRLSTIVDNRLQGSNTTTYAYDPASNLATATYPNGLQSTFTYDPLNRLTALSSPVSSYSYQLGPTGNRTSATEGTGRALTWSYDGIYRLTNETVASDPASKNGTVGYTLDPVGNRKGETATLGGLNPGSFNYNVDDEATTDGYDLNGNTVSTSGKTFAYDSENRMTSMNGGAVTMLYDGDGNRVGKTVNSVTTRYLVDDLNPTGYPQVVEELSANGTVARRYSYGIQLISQSQIENSVWTPSFYETDGSGSVRQLTDAAGAVTDTYEYDAFGNEISSTGTTPNNYLYRSEQWDSDLGLYYLRARYYNPLTGRFASVDSEAGEGQRRYEYAAADPIDGMDPTGNEAIVEFALLQFYPGRLPFNLGFRVSWCGFAGSGYLLGCGGGSGGSGGSGGGPGGPPPPPPCSGPNCKKCKADFRARPALGGPSDPTKEPKEIWHSYWQVTKADGAVWSISAGPANGFLNMTEDQTPPPLLDSLPGRGNQTIWHTDCICESVEKMISAGKNWPQFHYHYLWSPGPNSNTFARYIGAQGHLYPYVPPQVLQHLYGWDYELQ